MLYNIYAKTIKELAEYFGLPVRTAQNWAKEDDWRADLLRQLDRYKVLEERAVKHAIEVLGYKLLDSLIFALMQSDTLLQFDDFVYDYKERVEENVLWSNLDEKTREILLLKLKELCEFELYALIKAIVQHAYYEDGNNIGYSTDKLLSAYGLSKM